MTANLILFSPTGGTERAGRLLCSALAEHTALVDLSDPALPETALRREEVAVLALPSYGGRVPALAAQRLQRIRGNGAPCVLLCVYGNRAYEDTLVEMEDLARACGFSVLAAVSAVAEHSILHQFATGRPDATDSAALENIGRRIRAKLDAGKTDPPTIPGNRPYKKAGGVPLVPKAGSDCVHCGLCARHCPAQAIFKENLKTADAKKCIACMRCVVRCPHHARKVNGAMAAAAALAIRKACEVRKECEVFL